ncbi:MAG: hypothetical protein AAGJ46_12585 [Planctomycetota bacterium]
MIGPQHARFCLSALILASISAQATAADLFYTARRNSGVGRFAVTAGEGRGTLAPTTAYREGFDDFVGLAAGPDRLLYVSSRYYDDSRFGRWGVFRFDPRTGDFLDSFVDGGPYYHIQFGPDGDLYGVAGFSDSLHRLDGETGEFKGVVLDGNDFGFGGVGRFTIAPNGTLFAATDASSLAPYDAETGQRIGPITNLARLGLANYRYDAMAIGPNGSLYAAYNYSGRDQVLDGGVLRLDGATGELLEVLIDDIPAFGASNGGSLGLAFGPDGDLYVGSQHASSIFRYDPTTGSLKETIPIPGGVTGASHVVFAAPEPGSAGLAWAVLQTVFTVRGRRLGDARLATT